MEVFCISLCLLLFFSLASAESWNKTIYVSPRGNDSNGCLNQVSPCRTIDSALQKALEIGANSTRVYIERGSYNLSTSFSLERTENFAIYGEGNAEDVFVNCAENTSLAFSLVKHLVLQGFTLRQCGDWHTSSVGPVEWRVSNPKFITSVYINYCHGLQIRHVKITETPGVGLNGYTMSGSILFLNSTFEKNTPLNVRNSSMDKNQSLFMTESSGEYAIAGGGVYLSLGLSKNNPLTISSQEAMEYTRPNSVITINNCHFSKNKAPTPNSETTDVPTLPFSRGGGLAIFLTGNSTNNSIFVDSSEFTENEAVWGGGLQIEVQNRAQNNTFTVSNTVFKNNIAIAEGGGLRLSSRVVEELTLLPNYFIFSFCQMFENTATWGGGLATYGATFLAIPYLDPKYQSNEITFASCNISGNKGTVGSAIGAFLVNRNADDIGPGVPYHLIFENCTISDNDVITIEKSYVVGQGAVYTDEVPLVFKSNVTIAHNTGTAVVLDSATLEIYNHVHFIENDGFRGGALALYGDSKVILMKKSCLLFLNNSCDEKGGAMYVEAPGPPLVSFNASGIKIHKCFFTYEIDEVDFNDWDTEVIFQGNSVRDRNFAVNSSGRSVFATTLQECRRVGELRGNNTALEWKIIKYKNINGNNVSIEGEVVTEPIDIHLNLSDWAVSPSQVFNATVKLVDEKGNNVYGIVQITVHGLDSLVQLKGTSLQLVYNEVKNLRIIGHPRKNFSVVLKTTGKHLVRKSIENLVLQPCSPGYFYSDSKCQCSSSVDVGIYNCSLDGKTIFIRDGYWAGLVDRKLVTHICPETYCEVSRLSGQSIAYPYDNETMCIESRSSDSILCGACKANNTVVLGSEECSSSCSNLYLLMLIPYGMLLFLGVMVLMIINLDVFTGYLNAWLYSYQVMGLLFINGFSLDPFMKFVVGLANMQIKTGGSCFMNNIDDADKLVIMYLLPTYVLASVFILAKIVRKFPNWCYSRRVKAPFRALCTIFVLCYTNITSISLKILYPAFIGDKTVMFMDGEVEFFKGKHIGYAIIAIFFLVFIVIPCPLILLFTPFFTKILKPVFNVFTLKPYYDAFQGCFKDDFRWCSAFYFVCRLYLLLVSIYMLPGPWKRVLLESSCMCIVAVFLYLKPYKQEYNWLNFLDAVLLSNLGIITVFSTALDNAQYSNNRKSYQEEFEVFIKVLSYVPLCYLVCFLVYMVFQYRENLKIYMANVRLRAESTSIVDNHNDQDSRNLVQPENYSEVERQLEMVS